MKYSKIAVIFMVFLLASCDAPTEPPIPKTHDESASADEGRMLKLEEERQRQPEQAAE